MSTFVATINKYAVTFMQKQTKKNNNDKCKKKGGKFT